MPTLYHAGIEGEFVELKPMVGDKDIWLAAEGLLVAHGPNAVRKCEELIATMIERGDKAGAENWSKILAAVRELYLQGRPAL